MKHGGGKKKTSAMWEKVDEEQNRVVVHPCERKVSFGDVERKKNEPKMKKRTRSKQKRGREIWNLGSKDGKKRSDESAWEVSAGKSPSSDLGTPTKNLMG